MLPWVLPNGGRPDAPTFLFISIGEAQVLKGGGEACGIPYLMPDLSRNLKLPYAGL
jgi:hypothetical protein